MENTLYVHIGYEKTGTTVIQDFLQINRSVLEDAGYRCLPKRMGKYNKKTEKISFWQFRFTDLLKMAYIGKKACVSKSTSLFVYKKEYSKAECYYFR